MMIRSRVWAFRLALATSTLVALPALDLAPPAQAATKPSVALGPIEGKKAKDVRGWVLDALNADFVVTDAEEVVPKTGNNAAYAKAGKALGSDWVLTGKVEANKLVLTVRSSDDGDVYDSLEVKGAGAKLKRAIGKGLASSLAQSFAEIEGEEEEEFEAPKPKAKPKGKAKAAEEEAAEEEAAEPAEEEPVEEEPAEEEAAGDSAEISPLPRLVLMGGIEAMRRDFTYKDQINDFFPGARQLSDYHLPLQPGGFVKLEVYPAAFFSSGFVSNIGLTFEFHQGLTTKSSYVRDARPELGETSNVNEEFENLTQQWAVGARIRFPFESAEVGTVFQYGIHKFFLKGDEDQPIVPDVKYGYIKIGADAGFTLGTVTLGARLGVRLLGSLGEIESLWFPGATGTGLDAGIFGAIPFSSKLALVAGVDVLRYGFDFNAIPPENRVAAGGAIDQYFIGWLGVRFQLAGSGGGDAAAAEATVDESTAAEEDSADASEDEE
jgi:hypothetical protein